MIWHTVAALVLVSTSGPNPYAIVLCGDARLQSKQAHENLAVDLNSYIKCLNNRQEKDTCSHEFMRLELAQSAFARAVNNVAIWCDQ